MTRGYSDETQQGYTMDTVMEEAQRCLLCLDAPCSAACPAGTDPARFIRSVRFRNLKGAAETIRENNAIGGVCARVCPTERYCQQACSRCGIDRPIDIGGIQRFVTDFEETVGMEILKTGAANGKRLALLEAGLPGFRRQLRFWGLDMKFIFMRNLKKPADIFAMGFLNTVFRSVWLTVRSRRLKNGSRVSLRYGYRNGLHDG